MQTKCILPLACSHGPSSIAMERNETSVIIRQF